MRMTNRLALLLLAACAAAYAFQWKDINDVKTITFPPMGTSVAEKKVDGIVRAQLHQLGYAVQESGEADAKLTIKLAVKQGGGSATVDYDGLLEGADGYMIRFQLVGTHTAAGVEQAATLDGDEIAEVLKNYRDEHRAAKKKGN